MQTVQATSYISNFVFDASDLLKSQIFADFIVPHEAPTLSTSSWGVKNFAQTFGENVRTAQRERSADGLPEFPMDYASYLASYVKHLGLGILHVDSIGGVQVPLECDRIETEVLLDPLSKVMKQDHVTIKAPGADQSLTCDDLSRTIYGSSEVPFEPRVNTVDEYSRSGLVDACKSVTSNEGVFAHTSQILAEGDNDAPGPIGDSGYATDVEISAALVKDVILMGLSLVSENEKTAKVVKPRKWWRKVFCMG